MPTAKKKAVVNVVAVVDELGEVIDETLTDDTRTGAATGVQSVAKLLSGIAGGVKAGKVFVSVDELTPGTSAPGGDVATATVTVEHTGLTGDDFIEIGPVRLTWKASPSGENEIDIKTTSATDATELARGINEHSILRNLVVASATNAEVTLTSKFPGPLGQFRLASSDVSVMGFSGDGETTVEASGVMSLPNSDTYAGVAGGPYEYRVSMGK